jgi:hypothetical protein
MSLLKRLNQTKHHRYKEVLDRYPRQNIAAELGITYGHYSSIITGVRAPSKSLELKMESLAEQILKEELGTANIIEIGNTGAKL